MTDDDGMTCPCGALVGQSEYVLGGTVPLCAECAALMDRLEKEDEG